MGECSCGMSLRPRAGELSVCTWVRSIRSGIDSTGLKVVIDGGRVLSLMLEVKDGLGLRLFARSYARIGAWSGMLNLKGIHLPLQVLGKHFEEDIRFGLVKAAFFSGGRSIPSSNADTRPSLCIIAARSFAPAEDIRIACRWGLPDCFSSGDLSAAGMTRSGVAPAQRLLTDSTEGCAWCS